jgi:5-methylcytosine-specific restriction protein A
MPWKPKKPCARPGCMELTNERFCPKHKREDRQFYEKYHRDPISKQFYVSTAWRKLRAVKLQQTPFCEECQRNNRHIPAEVVDHIVPRTVDRSRELDLSNLQSLCKSCHSKKTGRENFKPREYHF